MESKKLLEMSLSVLKNVLPKIFDVQFLNAFIDFALRAIIDISLSGTKANDQVTTTLEEMKDCVHIWFKEPKVIGGSSFGGPGNNWNGKKELEVSLVTNVSFNSLNVNIDNLFN